MTASSSGERSSRCRFSMSAISSAVASSKRSTIAGIVSLPASLEARQRRSPAMISYSLPAGRTRIGLSTPCSRIDAASSASVSSCHVMRGWPGFGITFSSGMSRTAVGVRAASRLMMPGCDSVSCWNIRSPASRKDFLGRLLVSTDHLLRQVHEALCRIALGLVHGDRDARGGRFADLYGLSDHSGEDLVISQILQRVEHVAREDRAAVVERRQQAIYLETWIQTGLHRLDDLEKCCDTLERVVLRLHGNDHAGRRDERVQREQAERRRAIDEDVVVPVHHIARELVAQRHLAADRVEELDLGGRELEGRRCDVDLLRFGRPDDRRKGYVGVDEDVRDAALDRIEVDAETDGQVCLGIEVEAEDFVTEGRERTAEIDGARGLADAAFLVRDRYDVTQPRSPLCEPPCPGPLRVAVLPTARGNVRATSPARTITAKATSLCGFATKILNEGRSSGPVERRTRASVVSLRPVSRCSQPSRRYLNQSSRSLPTLAG